MPFLLKRLHHAAFLIGCHPSDNYMSLIKCNP